jgi:hypothetical protein
MMRVLTAVGVAALIVLCVLRRHDLGAAAVAVPPQALAALAALHLATLVARSEAWRLSLTALAGTPPSRAANHAANAGAFLAGALEPHAALPARVALLRRLAPHQLPHLSHVAVADMPILLLEAAGAAVLLGATGAFWAPAGALGLLVAARLAAGRRATRGLAVLADVRQRAALAVLVGAIVGCGLARVWLVLAVAHLDASPAAAALAFVALGVFAPARAVGAAGCAARRQRRRRRRRAGGRAGAERDLDRRGAAVRGRARAGSTRYPAIGPRRGSRPCSSKARKRLKIGCVGPWKSADPVVSSPRSAQRSAIRAACSASWLG